MCQDSLLLDVGARAFRTGDTSLARVNPNGTFSALVDALWDDLFEVDHKLLGIVLGISEKLGRVEGEDIVRDSFGLFPKKVRVFDT